MNGRKIKRGNPWEQDLVSRVYRKFIGTAEKRYTKRRANRRERHEAKEKLRREQSPF